MIIRGRRQGKTEIRFCTVHAISQESVALALLGAMKGTCFLLLHLMVKDIRGTTVGWAVSSGFCPLLSPLHLGGEVTFLRYVGPSPFNCFWGHDSRIDWFPAACEHAGAGSKRAASFACGKGGLSTPRAQFEWGPFEQLMKAVWGQLADAVQHGLSPRAGICSLQAVPSSLGWYPL